jgi:hypothetical protein
MRRSCLSRGVERPILFEEFILTITDTPHEATLRLVSGIVGDACGVSPAVN